MHLDAATELRGGQQQLLLLTSHWGGRSPLLAVVPEQAPVRPLLERAGVPVAALPGRPGLGGRAWIRALRAIAADFGATAIAAHDRKAAVLARGTRLPWVAHRRVDFAPSPWGYARYREARGVVAVSEAVARVMRQGGVQRVVVVHDGVQPLPLAPSDREGARRELGLAPEVPLVLAAGALVEHKAHQVLLRALPHLPEVHVAIAGTGPLEGPLRALASALGVARRVHLLGWRSDLSRWFASVDAFVHPSREEGLGQVVIEAAMAGAPLVSSQAGGLGELGLGRPFAPGDARGLARALAQALSDPSARASVLARRDQLVARFGVGRLIEETERAYRDFGC